MNPRRILIADDERLMAEALKLFVELDGSFAVVGLAENGLEAVRLCAQLRPEVVLMDLSMPVLDGLEATRRITAEQPGVRVLVVTTFASPEGLIPALRAGADGYVLKDSRPEEITAAVHDVLEGRGPISPMLTGALVEAIRARPGPPPTLPRNPAIPTLSDREIEVLDLLAQGLSNADMARELHLSEAAVKSRFTALMTKLDVTSRIQVLVRACELGLAQPRLRRGPRD